MRAYKPLVGEIIGWNGSGMGDSAGLIVLLQVGMTGLHAEGDWHLGRKVPVRMVPQLKISHAAAQCNILLVLEIRKKTVTQISFIVSTSELTR
uniref:Zmm16 n=1 Tax=Arundo donax TaxID=35708 RepID=A0A0A9DEH1_ARUDO